MNDLRIVSFLPAATEMAYALGLGGQVVGVTHECDYPAEARQKPVVVRPALPLEKMSLREIDVAVSERMKSGGSLYQVDETLLRELKPTLILTQNLCQVCAPSGNELTVALKSLSPKPEVLWLTPHSIEEIFENLLALGAATGRTGPAQTLVAGLRARLNKLAARTLHLPRPRVFCMEWADPVYCAGHWVPEMMELAGGADGLACRGKDSVRVQWEDVLKWAPEVIVFSPCGFNLGAALEQAWNLRALPGWADLPAVREGRVYAVDANSYFARPGPRVVDGAQLLAHLIHPKIFNWNGPTDAFHPLPASPAAETRMKTCPGCGKTFGCSAGECWCEHFPALPPSAVSAADCLCPTCLAKAIEAARKV